MPERNDIQSPIAHEVVAGVLLSGLANARARGELWQQLSEEFLGNIEQILRTIEETRLELLRKQAAPARAMAEMNETVLALLERLADAVWAERGQSPQDPFISILSPGTPNFFFDWPIGRPVDRVEAMLGMLATGKTPLTQSPEVEAIVQEAQLLLTEFRTLNESVRVFRAKLGILEKAAEVVARAGHVQYARLRRRLRAEGFDAGEVIKVFPDMPGVSTGTLG